MVRVRVRRFAGALAVFVGACSMTLAFSACTALDTSENPASQSPASPVSPVATPESPVATPEPPVETATTTWTAPEDPAEQGPTRAPELPEVEGALDEPIELSTGMVVAVDSITTMTVTPQTPGEYAGSAVVVRVSARNTSESVQNVDSAVVSLVAEDGEVGIGTTAGPNQRLQGDVPVGGSVTGSYVFMLEPAERRTVTVSVNYAAGEPIAKFTGSTT